jgi:DnaJ-class molecular chaperone
MADPTPTGQTCGTCHGKGTVEIEITNTRTGQVQVLPQTCLDCPEVTR